MMVRLPAAAAAFLALSLHVLPAIGFAFPSPQTSSSTCLSECDGVLTTFTECNISLDATTYTVAQGECMCNSSSFKSSVDQCFACLGQGQTYTYQDLCPTDLSSSTSSASRSATRSASASSASASATRTSGSATRTTSASSSGATESSTTSCAQTEGCIAFNQALTGCGVNMNNIDNVTDTQMICLCGDPTFAATTVECLKCAQADVSGMGEICDPYVSSSGLASGTATRSTTRATGTARTTDTGSSATTTAAIASNPTTTSTTGGTGNALSQNGGSRTVALGVPGLMVPVLVMAAAAWRVVF